MSCSFVLENRYSKKYKFIAGVDEAGRGALAGPVVCGVVILDKNKIDERINDSKKLNPQLREELYSFIVSHCLSFSLGVVSSQIIDQINILQAVLKAAHMALQKIPLKPDFLLTDYLKLEESRLPYLALKKGDQISYSIAAASIVAKVSRDRIMKEYQKKYPEYDFENNKGYPVKKHYLAIKKNGITDIHRKSFHLFH